MNRGDYPRAQTFLEEELTLSRTSGHWTVMAYILDDIGILARKQNNFEQAEIYFNEMRDLPDQEGNWDKSYVLARMASLAYPQREYERAQELGRQSLTLAIETNNTGLIAENLKFLGLVAYGQGKLENAVRQRVWQFPLRLSLSLSTSS